MSLNSQKNTWTRINIKDGCISITDCVNKTAKKTDYKTPYKMLRTTNVKKGWIDLENVGYVTEEIYNKWTRREVPKKGDIILTREAPLGEVGILRSDDKVFLGQRLVSYRANQSVLDNKFLFYAFLTHDLASQIKSLGSGSTVQHMRVPDAEKLTVSAPEIEAQRVIGSIISSYDDLIENNEKRIRILEEMSGLLYDEWFVKFKFPGHESMSMIESNTQYGKIPEGWEIGEVSTIIDVISGFPFKASTYKQDATYKIVTIKNVHDGKFVLNFDSYIEKLPTNLPSACKLNQGDILLSLTGNVGRICVVYGTNHLLNQRVAKLSPVEINKREFIYLLFRQNGFQKKLEAMSNGAAQQNLSPIQVKGIKIIIPSEFIIEKFSQIAGKYFDLSLSLQKENQNLTKARDLLIPQLVTGKRELK